MPRPAYETWHACLKRAVWSALRVGGSKKEKSGALDECLVFVAERCTRQFFFKSVSDAPTIEAILKTPVAVVVHNAHPRSLTSGSVELLIIELFICRSPGAPRSAGHYDLQRGLQ